MLSRFSILGLAAIGLLAFGCGKSNDSGTTQATPPAASVPASAARNAPAQDPKVVVAGFLEAFRKGDNDAAMKLLTNLARQKVAETGRCVTPPANDRARFEIEEVEYPTSDHEIAHVPAKWIVPDDVTGEPHTDKATWVCRLEPEGWRVAAFAAYVFDGEPPLLLSFEDPAGMAKQQKLLDEEIQRRSKEETTPPPSGENPLQAEQKPKDAFRR